MRKALEAVKAQAARRPVLYAALLLSVLVLAFYSNSFTADWHYDDFHHIKENINIRRIDNIPLFFKDPTTFSRSPQTKMYRPLLMTTHAINYWIGIRTTRDGYDVRGYHVVNFLFHLVTTLLVFFITLFLFRERIRIPSLDPVWPALFAGLLFGLQTINTETVVYVSSRSAGMATMFTLWSLYYYLRATRDTEGARTAWIPLLVSAFLYLCGFLTKEIAVTLPGLLLLYELTLNRAWMAGRKAGEVALKLAARLAPFAVVLAAILQVRLAIYGENLRSRFFERGGTQAATDWVSQLSTQTRATAFYLREWFLPTGLSIDKPFAVSRTFGEPVVLASLALIAVIVFFALRQVKKHPAVTLGVLWFFVALLPEALFRLNVVINDHRLYLPGFGFVLVFTYLAAKLYVRFREDGGWFFKSFAILCAAVILLMGLGTFKRNGAFATEETMWKDVILKDDKSVRGYNNLGIYYEQSGDLDRSIKYYNKTIQLAPMFPNPYINLGNVFHKKKDYAKAETYMKRALVLEPGSALAAYNLGNILREAGKTDEAIDSYKRALKENPRYIEAANNLANIFFSRLQYKDAVDYYQKALLIDPTFAMSYYNVALSYENLGEHGKAIDSFRRFLQYWLGDDSFRRMAETRIQQLEVKLKGGQ